jgi:hypothetical protein
VVTRLLDGEQIRQQRLSRDFATRFRELEGRRAEGMGWREWVALVAELAEWEVRLGQAEEPGLQSALRDLQGSLRQDFARFIGNNYLRWLREGGGDRPPLSVDIGAEFLAPLVRAHGKALLVVVDCLRLDQWEVLRPLIATRFEIETAHYFSILPTATPFARNAIFSGLLPSELAARHPTWWRGLGSDESSLNSHEAELLTEQLAELAGQPVPVRYEKVSSPAEGEALLRRLSGHLSQPGVTALVFNFIDQLTHGRSENPALFEVARDAAALRSLTRTWFERSGRRSARPTAGVCRCCSPPITARFTVTPRPRSTPAATRPAICATSSARICGPRTSMRRCPSATWPPSACRPRRPASGCSSRRGTGSSSIPPSSGNTRPATGAPFCTAASHPKRWSCPSHC